MVCGRPSSSSRKSSFVRLRTTWPFLSRTVANRLTTLTPAENVGCCWPRIRRNAGNTGRAHSKRRRVKLVAILLTLMYGRSNRLLYVSSGIPIFRPEFERAPGGHLVELHRKTAAAVIRLPLIAIMARENLPGLADGYIQQRPVPIAQVHVHSHRRREAGCGLLDGSGRAAHRHRPEIEEFSNQRQLMNYRVIDLHLQVRPVLPSRYLAALHARAFLYGIRERPQQHLIVITKPALRTFA